LIWSGLWRKRARTILTMISVTVAFLLFGILDGVTSAFDLAVERYTDDTELRTESRLNIGAGLPISHLGRIEKVPGVRAVGFISFVGGYFQEPKNPIGAAAVDPHHLPLMMKMVATETQIEALQRTRAGALIGPELVERYGWKTGDRVTLKSPIWIRKDGSTDWEYEIVGVYTLAEDEFPDNDTFYVNYDYFDEARAYRSGTVNGFVVTIDDVERTAQIAADIDRLFANSPDETLTMSESDAIHAQINRVGNISYIVNAIIAAVLFALLFVTGNTMMQSIRERIPELAVLKTYGYGDVFLAVLVLVETAVLCVTSAAIGLGIAALVFPTVFDSIGVAALPLETRAIAEGLVFAVLLAVASALPPVWRAKRLKIVDALAGR